MQQVKKSGPEHGPKTGRGVSDPGPPGGGRSVCQETDQAQVVFLRFIDHCRIFGLLGGLFPCHAGRITEGLAIFSRPVDDLETVARDQFRRCLAIFQVRCAANVVIGGVVPDFEDGAVLLMEKLCTACEWMPG